MGAHARGCHGVTSTRVVSRLFDHPTMAFSAHTHTRVLRFSRRSSTTFFFATRHKSRSTVDFLFTSRDIRSCEPHSMRYETLPRKLIFSPSIPLLDVGAREFP